MRRLSTLLMIAALFAVLVASPISARGKPVPVINSVTVTEENLQGPDSCAVTVAITFTGRAQYARFAAVKDGAVVSTPTPELQRKTITKSQTFQAVSLGANAWSWKVQLLDRKLRPLGVEVQTSTETWTSGTCPANGTPLAAYP